MAYACAPLVPTLVWLLLAWHLLTVTVRHEVDGIEGETGPSWDVLSGMATESRGPASRVGWRTVEEASTAGVRLLVAYVAATPEVAGAL